MMDDPRVSIIDNASTAEHRHMCPEREHAGEREYMCTAPRCLTQILVLICPTCSGPTQKAWVPHRLVRYDPPTAPGQRVLPYS